MAAAHAATATLTSAASYATATVTRTFVARAAAAVVAGNPNPTTPPFTTDMQWITAYLAIHMLSVPSRRYSYILWFAFALVFFVFSLFHLLRIQGGYIGAYWSRWSIRRKTWRKGRRVAGVVRIVRFVYPSNAQILALAALFAVVAILCVAGPDYIVPSAGTFNLSKRSDGSTTRIYWDPLQFLGYAPQYTIQKAWWTAGGRTGMMAFALFPLCVLCAIKGSPFALLSVKGLVQLQFDKLSWLHWFTGWFIWTLVALHAAFWSVQLMQDRRTSPWAGSKSKELNQKPYDLVWGYTRFIYAWIAFGLLTLLCFLSVSPLRRTHYETFYFLHILLVPFTLVLSALHHPPIWWWCWAALALWLLDRLWRGVRWAHVNGIFGIPSSTPPGVRTTPSPFPRDAENIDTIASQKTLPDSQRYQFPTGGGSGPVKQTGSGARYPPTPGTDSPGYSAKSPMSASSMDLFLSPVGGPVGSSAAYIPPPGYLHAELLAGHTVRVTLTPARPVRWAPGQHVLITVPELTALTSHPFTAASICDARALRSPLVLLIRAKAGWTKELWDEVAALTFRGQKTAAGATMPEGTVLPPKGVLMRGWFDGPFGSSDRARWGDYSTVLLVAGGSGVSFTLSVLEYICLCMAGRDGKDLGGHSSGPGQTAFKVKRVRFVWIIREFSHMQWCASILRRCMELVPFPGLQIDIFVTNAPINKRTPAPSRPVSSGSFDAPSINVLPPADSPPPHSFASGNLAPPSPNFARGSRSGGGSDGESGMSDYSSGIDLGYYSNTPGAFEDDVEDVVDLTNWDGDNDAALPGEHRLSRQVQSAGRHMRTMSRRMSQFQVGGGADENGLRGFSWLAPSVASGEKARYSHMSASTDRLMSGGGAGSANGAGGEQNGSRGSKRVSWIAEPFVHGRSPLAMSSTAAPTSPTRSTRRLSNFVGPSPIEEGSHEGAGVLSDDESATVVTSRPQSSASQNWDARSTADSVNELVPGSGASRHGRSRSEQVRLEVESQEMQDLSAVAEFARPGRPRLNRFLAEEVDRSHGAVVVGCCGPASLNAMIRKVISAQIDPAKIRKGDMRGHISLVSEEFDY